MRNKKRNNKKNSDVGSRRRRRTAAGMLELEVYGIHVLFNPLSIYFNVASLDE